MREDCDQSIIFYDGKITTAKFKMIIYAENHNPEHLFLLPSPVPLDQCSNLAVIQLTLQILVVQNLPRRLHKVFLQHIISIIPNSE